MKRTLAALMLLLAGPAIAADMPVKSPVQPAVTTSTAWSGLYFGVNGGGAMLGNKFDSTIELPGTGNLRPSAGLAGLTAGWGFWSPTGPYFGIEVDGDYDFTKQNVTCFVDVNCKVKSGFLFTQRVIVGATLSGITGVAQKALARSAPTNVPVASPPTLYAGNLMVGLTGGVAERRLEACIDPAGCQKEWLVGWTIGPEIKASVASNWSLDAKYLYINWNKNFIPASSGPAIFNAVPFKATTEHLLMLGLSYHL